MTDKGSVLAVDDTPDSLQMLVDILRNEGYHVRPADSGSLALSAAVAKPPELILLDIRMPGMDGFEVLRRLKGDERCSTIPVIFISALTDTAERVEGLRLGAVDFISKPFQREELLARVKTHLELGRLRNRLEASVAQRTRELHDSIERLELATQAGIIGIWDWDVVNNQLLWDDNMHRLYSIRQEDFDGTYEAWSHAIHPDDKERTKGEIKAALRGEKEYALEFRIVRPDGTVRFIQAASRTFRDKDGKAQRMIGTNIDITERKLGEEALENSERRLSDIISFLPDVTFAVDLDGRVILWNRAAEELTGVPAGDILGKGDYEYAIPFYGERRPILIDLLFKPAPEIEALYPSLKREGEMIFGESYTQIARRGEAYLMGVAAPLYNSEGNVIGAIETIRDITERKRAEQALRRQADFDAIITRILARFASCSAAEADARIQASLIEMTQFAGVDAAFVIAMEPDHATWSVSHWWLAPGIPDISAEYLVGIMEQSSWSKSRLMAGEMVVINSINDFPPEAVAERNTFEKDDVRSQLLVPLRGRGGEFAGCVGFRSYVRQMNWVPDDYHRVQILSEAISNVLERKRSEEALRESEARTRTILDSVQTGLMIIDPETHTIVETNPLAARLIGRPREKVVGNICHTYICPVEKGHCPITDLGQTLDNSEHQLLKADGTNIPILKTVVPVILGGRRHLLESFVDISERKQAEEQREELQIQLRQAQKMEAIGTLVGGISHDFNNLLQAINGYAQILLFNKTDNDPEYPSLKAIQNAGNRAAELVRQLLLFSRKADMVRQPIDLNQEIEQARRMLERTIPKMIDIVVHPGSRLWSINADPIQIEQILLNLGVNAADAMPDGGSLVIETENITLDEAYIQKHVGATAGNYVLLTVSDTGRGMDKETAEHIFEPFYTTKETGKGTGLGLASVYGIVKSHGGNIISYSEVGQGTTFKIYLPAIKQTETAADKDLKVPTPQGGTETILLVDDEESIRDFSSSVLIKFGYAVLTASSGEEALEIYSNKSNKIDLVLMDIGMPGMGGHKCLQEILLINPTAKVIIASGYSISDQVKKTLDAGALGYVGKPYQVFDLLEKVRAVLDQEN